MLLCVQAPDLTPVALSAFLQLHLWEVPGLPHEAGRAVQPPGSAALQEGTKGPFAANRPRWQVSPGKKHSERCLCGVCAFWRVLSSGCCLLGHRKQTHHLWRCFDKHRAQFCSLPGCKDPLLRGELHMGSHHVSELRPVLGDYCPDVGGLFGQLG